MKRIDSLEYSSLMWFLIRACFIEITSGLLINLTGEDAWISLLLGLILGVIPFCLYTYIKSQFQDKNIISINTHLFGKFGHIFNFIIIITMIILCISNFWTLVHFINSQFLYNTSPWLIGLIFIIPIGYAVTKGLRIIGKISLIMFYITIFFIILILIGLIGGIDLSNLKPIFNHPLSNIIYGSFFFINFNVLSLFILTIIPNNKIIGHSLKKEFIFYFISTLSLLNVLILTISIFGIELSYLYDYPSFHLLKRVSVLDIIDRVESILSLEWVIALFIQITMTIYFITTAITQTLKLKEKTNKYLIIFICFTIFFISNFIFKTHSTDIVFFKNFLTPISFIVFLGIPFITLIGILHHKIFRHQNTNSHNYHNYQNNN